MFKGDVQCKSFSTKGGECLQHVTGTGVRGRYNGDKRRLDRRMEGYRVLGLASYLAVIAVLCGFM